MIKTNLYVIRDDGEYDFKEGFKTFKEANDYRIECQRCWINHYDVIILEILSDEGITLREINLTELRHETIESILSEYGITME